MTDRHHGPAQAFDGGEVIAIQSGPPWPTGTCIVYSVPPKEAKGERKDEDAARLDAARETAKAHVAAQLEHAGVGLSAGATAKRGGAAPTATATSRGKRRPRRTKAEMAAARQREAERLEQVKLLATPDWLTEGDQDLDELIAENERIHGE